MSNKSLDLVPRAGLLLCLMATWSLASAVDTDLGSDTLDRDLPRIKDALNAQGDADSLAAVATLDDPEAALANLARAVMQAPDRPYLVWLELVNCARMPACDPEPYSAALHRADPDNGAAWAALLDRAHQRGDLIAETRYLHAIGASKRFDIYWNVAIARMSAALLTVRAGDVQTVLTRVIGRQAALAIPPYTNISKDCNARALEEPGRLDDCRGVAAAMRNGDTYITEMVGIAIAKRVWPENSAEHAAAVASGRLGKYRMASEAALTSAKPSSANEAQQYLELLRSHRSEQEVTFAVISAAGKDVSPPPDGKESPRLP